MTFDAVVLAGGEARRLGGVDKPALSVGGISLLDRVLGACVAAGAQSLTVVGPERTTDFDVVWTRESPVGGGPVPAVAAGLAAGSSPLVAVLAADLPFLDADALRALLDGLQRSEVDAETDANAYVDAHGHIQPLVAVYRRRALAAALDRVTEHDGARLWSVLESLSFAQIPDTRGVTVDCDTWERVDAARTLLAASPPSGEDGQYGRTS